MKIMRIIALVPMLLVLLTSSVLGLDIREPSFIELAIRCDAIVTGKISKQGQEVNLAVSRTLKGNAAEVVGIHQYDFPGVEPAIFTEGEQALLFLSKDKDAGDYYLACIGEGAKWPKTNLPNAYGKADIAHLSELVASILSINEMQSPDDKARGVEKLLSGNDDLAQQAGLDILLPGGMRSILFPKELQSRYESEITVYAIPLLKHKDTRIRGLAAYTMVNLPNIVAAPLLIPMINDEDRSVRNRVKSSLGRVIADGHINDDEIDAWLKCPLDQDDSKYLNSVQSKIQKRWDSIRAKRMERELPRIKAKLSSASSVEREAGAKMMELVEKP